MIHVEFTDGKIGRRDGVQPQWFATRRGGEDLPDAMYSFVKKHLASREITITTYADGTGDIVAGMRVVGKFTWAERSEAP